MNHHQDSYTKGTAYDIAMIGIVAALYIVLTFILAPLSFGPGFRISEGLNFLALYNKRHIYAITIGVFIVNYFAYGVWDMIVGSLSSLVFLFICRWIGKWLSQKIERHTSYSGDPMIIQYVVLIIGFSLSMFTIALLTLLLGFEEAFWPVYWSMVMVEAGSLILGAVVMYPLSKRIDFTR